MSAPFRTHSAYLRERFGGKVRRLSIDAGFGCPHRDGGRGPGGCLFCDGRGSGTGALDAGVPPLDQARRARDRLRRQGVERFIAYLQAFSGTLAPPERLMETYTPLARLEGVVGLTVSTRPDLLSEGALDVLAAFAPGGEAGLDLDVWVEIGLQSASNATLRRLSRGHDAACFDDAVRRAAARGLKTAAHVILGLPGEEERQFFATARHLAELPIRGVKMHHLYVTRDSAMAALHARGEVVPLSLEAYLPAAIGFLRRLPPEVVVLRVCGSAPRDRLIAPRWRASSGEVARLAAERMLAEGVRQGDLWRPSQETVQDWG